MISMKRWLFIVSLAGVIVPRTPLPAQQNPSGVLPLHTAAQPFLLLIRDPIVHQDLQLTEEQVRALVKANDQLDADMWSTRNKTPQDRADTLNQLILATKGQLASILSKEQVDRIDQIELWVLGVKSVARDDVAQRLDLDSQQREMIRKVLQTSQQETSQLHQRLQEGGNKAELDREYRQVQIDMQQGIVAVLNEQQKQKWRALLGRRVDVSKLGRIKFKAPEFQPGSGWVNSEPLTMEKLKGKVVALHFYAFA